MTAVLQAGLSMATSAEAPAGIPSMAPNQQPGSDVQTPVGLSPLFCSLFQGVCTTCPNSANNRCQPPPKPVVVGHLPPAAAQAIDALARCRGLTNREVEVLTLVCTGLKNSVIASALGVSMSAIRQHLQALHRKTRTADKAELILNLWHSCLMAAPLLGAANPAINCTGVACGLPTSKTEARVAKNHLRRTLSKETGSKTAYEKANLTLQRRTRRNARGRN